MKRRSYSSDLQTLRPLSAPRSRWLMLGAAALAPTMPAAGQTSQATTVQHPVDAARLRNATFTFDIVAAPLDVVATAFEAVTSVPVVFTNSDIGTLPSPGLRGVMTAESALAQFLSGTGVQATFHADRIELALAAVSENVDVVGVTTPGVSSPRYTMPLRDVAQTIAVVPRTVIEERAATTLTDVLRNVPGITLQAGEGGGSSNTAGDMFNMRGFSANNSLFVDNVRDSGLIARDVFNVEQVEVFMGPSGSDVGRGTAAGYVNMASKRPHLGTDIAVMAGIGTAGQGRVTADLNWGAPEAAQDGWWSRSAVRLNALWQDRGVPGRDYVKNESTGVAPALELGLGSPTRVFANGQFVRQDNLPDYGIPSAADFICVR